MPKLPDTRLEYYTFAYSGSMNNPLVRVFLLHILRLSKPLYARQYCPLVLAEDGDIILTTTRGTYDWFVHLSTREDVELNLPPLPTEVIPVPSINTYPKKHFSSNQVGQHSCESFFLYNFFDNFRNTPSSSEFEFSFEWAEGSNPRG